MRAATYARKSTEDGREAADTSLARQEEQARLYAERKGWTVGEVYSDDGISGAEFVNRPGLVRLLAALKPSPPFDVLIMSEESRLGREAIETAYVAKQIMDAGVRVFFYMEDRERTLDSAMDKVMLSLSGFASEMEREKGKLRTYDALSKKARSGYVTGGTVFGYKNVEVMNGDTRSHVVREVVTEEADVIRRIFTMAAEGPGLRRIAFTLTEERVPAPRKDKGWAPTAVREMLKRDLYVGRLVWGKTKRVDKGGRVGLKATVPEAEWQTAKVPELRIVSDELWAAAQGRLAATRAAYLRDTNGRLGGRPQNGIESPYLLTGFATCSMCGSSMMADKRGTGGYYRCSLSFQKGKLACANALLVPMAEANRAVLEVLQQEILDADVIAQAMDLVAKRYTDAPEELGAKVATTKAELAKIEAELGRLVEALAGGEGAATITAAIKARERRRGELQAAIEHLDGLSRAPRMDSGKVKAELAKRLADWRGILAAEPVKARQLLRKLILGRLSMTPNPETKTYGFKGTAVLGRVLQGVAGHQDVAYRLRAPISSSRPSSSWRITTRLASHARRRDVSAATRAPSSRTDWPGCSGSASAWASTWTTTW